MIVFTLNLIDRGVDIIFFLELRQMKALVIETKQAGQSLGKVHYEEYRKRYSPLLGFIG